VKPFTLGDAIVVACIAAALSLGLLLRVGASVGGTLVAGEVIGKREAIEMPLGDTWRHVFEVSYRYRPPDTPRPLTGRHQVDVTLFDRLRIGSPVGVRHRRLPFFGTVFGPESALDESSWWTRVAASSESTRETVELAVVALAGALGFLAYRYKSRALGFVATAVGAAVASTVLLLGWLVLPALFWLWRASPGKGFGWVLLASTTLTAAGLYARVPWVAPLPEGSLHQAAALVRAVRVVDRIWASSTPDESSAGQSIRMPFQMVDLEFTPAGRTEAVHALDRVDLGSVSALRVGATVPVIYSEADPRAGRMSAGTRNFGRQAATYLLALTYGIGALIAVGVLALLFIGQRLARMLRRHAAVFDPAAVDRLLSALPDGDPRRTVVERLRQLRDSNLNG